MKAEDIDLLVWTFVLSFLLALASVLIWYRHYPA